MPVSQEMIRQIHQIGSDTPERLVPDNVCPGQRAWGLGATGLTDAGVGYAMMRPRPPSAHLLACYGGAGEVWVGGKWVRCTAGEAYLAPPLAPMAFRSLARPRWQFAWVYLIARDGEPSPISGHEPTLVRTDPRQVVNAIEGLYLEASGPARVERLDLWADLVNDYVRAITRAAGDPDPLWRLWAEVDIALNEPWTLNRLAERAGLRPEALRRLCVRHLGRSPMRQVTHLRMRRAEALLRSTSGKLFAVAQHVGYDNAFAFSTAFRRWKGVSPNHCRKTNQGLRK